MTNEEQATALKELVDTLAQEGDQWLLKEPFVWEKRAEWVMGDITPYPHNLDAPLTEDALKAAIALDSIISNTLFNHMFTCVFREGEMMVFSVPELYDIMVPFRKGTEVYLSKGPKDLYRPWYHQPYYKVYAKTKLWVNGEKVDPENEKELTEAGLKVLGRWSEDEGVASRCQGKHPIVCIRQESYSLRGCSRPGGWPVHGPVFADPTCIFYKV